MKVSVLIERLRECDPNADVCFADRVRRDASGKIMSANAGDEICHAYEGTDETGPFVGLA